MDVQGVTHLRIEGADVALEPVRPTHATRLFPRIHGRRAVLRWLVWEGPESEEELERAYAEWRSPSASGVGVHLVVLDRATDRPLGTIGVRFRGAAGVGDVGYWLGETEWGRGVGTEAVRLAAWLAFHHLGARSLCAWVDVGNQGSRRVLEKNGFRLQVTVSDRVRKREGPVDQWGFVATRADWDAATADAPAPALRFEPAGGGAARS